MLKSSGEGSGVFAEAEPEESNLLESLDRFDNASRSVGRMFCCEQSKKPGPQRPGLSARITLVRRRAAATSSVADPGYPDSR